MRYTEGNAAIVGLGTIVLAPTDGSYEAFGVRTNCPADIATTAGTTFDGAA